MKAAVVAAVAGALFALGLVVSGMTVPARVVAFLDVRHWDPTLAFVMGGALLVHAPLARAVRRRGHPIFDARFHDPAARRVDARLAAGAALFGVGWGLSGYCPGPALVSLAGGGAGVLVFAAALVAGIAVARASFRAPRSS